MSKVNTQTSGGSYPITHMTGGELVSEQTLLSWVEGHAFQLVDITRDEYGIIESADVIWPDSSEGTFTTLNANIAHRCVDAFRVSHDPSELTVLQSTVSRSSGGAITGKPQVVIEQEIQKPYLSLDMGTELGTTYIASW